MKLCKFTREILSSVSFHQYFQEFHMNFKIYFRYLVLLKKIEIIQHIFSDSSGKLSRECLVSFESPVLSFKWTAERPKSVI